MPEWERDGDDGTPAEAALDETLTRVGPLLRRRADLGAPDPAFVARLRAHLAPNAAGDGAPVVAPSPAALGARLRRRGGRGVGAGLMAAALVAAVLIALLVVVRPHHPAQLPVAAWLPPLPTVADLTRGFPAPAVAHAAGPVSPTASLAAPSHGLPYAGHVGLSTVPLPPRPARLRAFRLALPASSADPAHVVRLARSLGIYAPIRRTARGQTVWLVAADGGTALHRSLHSLAVATTTGEVVYHDALATRREPWVDNLTAVATARAWLARLGWPGARMPLAEIEHGDLPVGLRAIEFRWVGVGAAATDAVTLWVTPHGHVVEADVWPPIERTRSIPARSIVAAWTAVRGHMVPLAVEGVPPHTGAPGVGVMRRVTITYVLSTGADRRLYLVPAYHFAGTARLRGIHGERLCYALAPAGR